MNDIDRIASREYEPSDDDVVRARLRTLGVQEHKIKFTKGARLGFSFACVAHCMHRTGSGLRVVHLRRGRVTDAADGVVPIL